jgi:hypothetical protein
MNTNGPPGSRDGDGRPATPGHRTATHQIQTATANDTTTDHRYVISSRQINWYDTVFTWIRPWLEAIGDWPVIGRPAWSALADDDPRKWAAILDAAQAWALKQETEQVARCEASRDISQCEDWSEVSRRQVQRRKAIADGAYIPRRST